VPIPRPARESAPACAPIISGLRRAFRWFYRSGHHGSTSLNKTDLDRRDKDRHHPLPNFATVSQNIMRVVRYLTQRKINTQIACDAAESARRSTSSAR
jgi:hypothetical protein